MNTTNHSTGSSRPVDTCDSPGRRQFMLSLAATAVATTCGGFSGLAFGGTYDSPLEAQINRYIQGLRRRGLVSADERTAWSVYDFTRGEKLVAINEDDPLQAASMIKPFVAQAYFYKCSEQPPPLRYTSNVKTTMERMIRRSSNTATNSLMQLISRHCEGHGPRDVEQVLRRHAPGIFQQTRIVELIPPGGRTYRNRASAHDYSRFLYALWNDQLPYSAELRSLMALPNRDRINSGVSDIPGSTVVYDKTGTTARLCGNMGIVEARGRDGRTYPYTFVGIIEKSSRARGFSHWIRARGDVMREVSAMTYAYMKARYPLV